MSPSALLRAPRRALLATAIAAACAFVQADCEASADSAPYDSVHQPSASRVSMRHVVPMSHVVTSCGDDFNTPGTLRWILADPNTMSGDAVDLSQLTCSHISLGSELKVHQDDLSIFGPDPSSGYSLQLDADGHSEIFQHFGYGTLKLVDLEVVEGYFESSSDPTGGCIWSRGSISLENSSVARCTVKSLSAGAPALGGGIYTRSGLSLTESAITYSTAFSSVVGASAAAGGGAFVRGTLTTSGSTLAHNASRTVNSTGGKGGGVFARYGAMIETTTISDNTAEYGGGIMIYAGGPMVTGTVASSTISGNVAFRSSGGIYSNAPLKVSNSTIAFNSSRSAASSGAGLFASASLDLLSTIVADNWSPMGLSDLDTTPGVVISGSGNLIVKLGANAMPLPDTIDDCPRLDTLTNSGGATATLRIRQGSGAVDRGDDNALQVDQRGLPRVVGSTADIGAVERQDVEAEERLMSSSFEGHCDV
jgi:hypothetical protein